MRTTAALLAVLVATGCRYRPEPIPVRGERAEIARMAGTWVGEYSGSTSGRSGSITFTLQANADSAFGDVLMVPASNMAPLRPTDNAAQHALHARSPQVLQVSFVIIADGRVSGALEPYTAPDCECTVHTTFTGAVGSDAVEGTFVTRSTGGYEQKGRWRVMKR
jgi:hypothetical protein